MDQAKAIPDTIGVELQRPLKNGNYLTVFPKTIPVKRSVDRLDEKLAKQEKDAGVVYAKEFEQFIPKAPVNDSAEPTFYQKLRKNVSIKMDDVLKATDKESDEGMQRYLDLLLASGNLKKARFHASKKEFKHDLLDVAQWAEENEEDVPSALVNWSIRSKSPAVRALVQLYLAADTHLHPLQVAAYADFHSVQDAFVLSSAVFGNDEPLTRRLHQRWMEGEPGEEDTKEKPADDPEEEDVDLHNQLEKLATSSTISRVGLVKMYRCAVALLEKKSSPFRAPELLVLREIFAKSLVLKDWKLAQAVAMDLSERCNEQYLKDTLSYVVSLSQALELVEDAAVGDEEKKLPLKHNDFAEFFKHLCLADSVFGQAPDLDADLGEEDKLIKIDSYFRSLRILISRLKFDEEIVEHYKKVFNTVESIYKVLIDASSNLANFHVESPNIIAFIKTGVGLFPSALQNDRLREAVALNQARLCPSPGLIGTCIPRGAASSPGESVENVEDVAIGLISQKKQDTTNGSSEIKDDEVVALSPSQQSSLSQVDVPVIEVRLTPREGSPDLETDAAPKLLDGGADFEAGFGGKEVVSGVASAQDVNSNSFTKGFAAAGPAGDNSTRGSSFFPRGSYRAASQEQVRPARFEGGMQRRGGTRGGRGMMGGRGSFVRQ